MRACKDITCHAGIVLRLYPSNKQKQIIAFNDGMGRFIYNRLVALNRERYRLSKLADLVPAYKDRIEYIDSILRNPDKGLAQTLKNAAPFCYCEEADSLAVDNAIKNYNAAWKNYKENPSSGTPGFHKKGYTESYQTNAHYQSDAVCINDANVRFLDKNHVKLPILGRIRISGSKTRILELMNRQNTRIGTVTIHKDTINRYFVSFQIASGRRFAANLNFTGQKTGIDLNIDNFLWDSDNKVIDNPKFRRNMQKKLAKAQCSMSRKQSRAKKEGRPLSECKNYQKDRIRVAYILSKIKGRGDDFRHTISKQYVKNHDIIAAEDLKVKNLLKNHKLALAISECGWSDFLYKLEYKCEMYGKTFVKVPPRNTTQTCNACGFVLRGEDKLTLDDREWICPQCGTYHVRDHNAAKNILSVGLAILGDEAPACPAGNAKICPGDDNSPGKALTVEPLSVTTIIDKFDVSAKVSAVCPQRSLRSVQTPASLRL